MKVCLGKDRNCETGTMTATYVTVAGLTVFENVVHKLYMDSFFL